MIHNLTTKEGRKAAVSDIENSFLSTLRNKGFDVSPDAACNISSNSIELGIAAQNDYANRGFKLSFASEITLYCIETDEYNFGSKKNEISFGSSGSFDPSIQECYWRTIHAASILKKWNLASEIVNSHCKMYRELRDEIFKKTDKE